MLIAIVFFLSQALKSQRLIVTYEVIIGIQQLLNVSGRDLTEPSWDVLCEIMRTIADNITYYGKRLSQHSTLNRTLN